MTDSLAIISPANLTSSGASLTDFASITADSVGRLYAYRYSNTSVVLATRSAFINSSQEESMAVGLYGAVNEMYVCRVENFPERGDQSGISDYTVTITTQDGENCEILISPH